jgi:hypothetical protein
MGIADVVSKNTSGVIGNEHTEAPHSVRVQHPPAPSPIPDGYHVAQPTAVDAAPLHCASFLLPLRQQVRPIHQFAQQLGWPQPRVSKLETGRQLPTNSDLHAWWTATGAEEAQAAEFSELLSAARIEYATWRGVQRTAGGLAGRHAERAAWEAAQPGYWSDTA